MESVDSLRTKRLAGVVRRSSSALEALWRLRERSNRLVNAKFVDEEGTLFTTRNASTMESPSEVPSPSPLGIIDRLTASERARLSPYLNPVEILANDVLIEQGSEIPAVWFPIDSVTATVVRLPGGGEVEVGNMGSEGVVGLSLVFGVPHSNSTVICQIPGRAYCIDAQDFMEHVFRHGGELYEAILRYTNAFMTVIAQVAGCNTTHDVSSRLARWVLMTQDRTKTGTLRLTHEFMGRMLGVQRTTVTLALRGLTERGLIEHSYGTMTVLDRTGLEQAACPCYAIIRRVLLNLN